jgi:uncharacterized protein (DUF305 family)
VLVVAGLAATALGATAFARGSDQSYGPADVGFIRDMIDHHAQANLMSSIVLRGEASAPTHNLALDIVAVQHYEIGLMDGLLSEWDTERGGPDRDAMAWMEMGMVTRPHAMPGMATEAELDELADLSGHQLDIRFLELMLDHHRAGVHMADVAEDKARHPRVRWLAHQMARNQQREIRDIETLLGP